MSDFSMPRNSTGVILPIFIADSSTGLGKTGLVFNSSGLIASYTSDLSAGVTSLTLVSVTTLGTYVSGGFKEIDATNQPGWYQLHLPNAVLTSSLAIRWRLITLYGVSGMNPATLRIEITNDVVVFGIAAAATSSTITLASALGANSIPNFSLIRIIQGTGVGQSRVISGYVDSTKVITVFRAWTTTPDTTSVYSILYADLSVIDISGRPTVLLSVGTGSGQVNVSSGKVPATIATGDDVDGAALKTTVGTAGVGLTNLGDTRIANLDATVSSRASTTLIGTPAGASVSVDIAAINTKTANLPASPASTTNITAGTITTVTNVTNAPTAGDLTATMKTSVTTAATAATPTVSLASGEHTHIAADTQTGLTAQGYTTTRAGYLDTLNGLVAAIWAYATRVLTAGTNIVLAKGTGVTGFNDIAAGSAMTLSGDFTTTMKTSLNAATPSVTVSDKTGFSLTIAYDPAMSAAQAGDAMDLIPDALRSLDYTEPAANTYPADYQDMLLLLGARLLNNAIRNVGNLGIQKRDGSGVLFNQSVTPPGNATQGIVS
jgi:hypothetical protein